MLLDQEFFDSIQLNIHWKKYYRIPQVNDLLDNICQQAADLNAMLEALTAEKEALTAEKEALSAENEALRRQLEDEREMAEQSQAESLQQQEYAVQKVQACYSRIRQQYVNCIEAINADWQDFLCGLLPEEVEALPPVPADMAEKVSAIANELLAIGGADDKSLS